MIKKDKPTNVRGKLVNIILILLTTFLAITMVYISGISCSIFMKNKQNIQKKDLSVTDSITESENMTNDNPSVELYK